MASYYGRNILELLSLINVAILAMLNHTDHLQAIHSYNIATTVKPVNPDT